MGTILKRVGKLATTYRATIRRKGHKPVTKTFTTRTAAKTWLQNTETLVVKDKTQESNHTVAELISEYRGMRQKKRPVIHGSPSDFELRHLTDGLGQIKAFKITVKDVQNWVEYRLQNKGGIHALGKELVALKTVFTRCSIGMGYDFPIIMITRAIKHLENLGMIVLSSNSRERIATTDELKRILEYLDEKNKQIADAVRIAFSLGFRRSEILKLRWEHLDHEKQMIWVMNRKNPRKREGVNNHVRLLYDSYEILARQPKTSPLIFPDIAPEDVSDLFLEACRALVIKDLRLHDGRHTAITQMFKDNYKIHEVMMVSGHRSLKSLARYLNPKPEDLENKAKAA